MSRSPRSPRVSFPDPASMHVSGRQSDAIVGVKRATPLAISPLAATSPLAAISPHSDAAGESPSRAPQGPCCEYVQEAATRLGRGSLDLVLRTLQAEMRPVRIIKGGSDAKNTALEGTELDVVLVMADFAQSVEISGAEGAIDLFCNLALTALRKSARSVEVAMRRRTALGMKLELSLPGEDGSSPHVVDVLFTGEPEAGADGSPDDYFLAFYTLEQVAFVKGSKANFPRMHDAMQTLKSAARGMGFKGFFLEIACILEFQQNHRNHNRWANVALDVVLNQLGHKRLRSIRCPVTDAVVHVRGATADAAETERMVEALTQEVRRMAANSPPRLSVTMNRDARVARG